MKTRTQTQSSGRRAAALAVLVLYGVAVASYVAWAECNGKACRNSPTVWENRQTCTRYVRHDQDCGYPHIPDPNAHCDRIVVYGVTTDVYHGTPVTVRFDINLGICSFQIDLGCLFCSYPRDPSTSFSGYGYGCSTGC